MRLRPHGNECQEERHGRKQVAIKETAENKREQIGGRAEQKEYLSRSVIARPLKSALLGEQINYGAAHFENQDSGANQAQRRHHQPKARWQRWEVRQVQRVSIAQGCRANSLR